MNRDGNILPRRLWVRAHPKSALRRRRQERKRLKEGNEGGIEG